MNETITSQRLIELGKNIKDILQELERAMPAPNPKAKKQPANKVAHYLNKIK